jgi:maltoporin
LRLITVIAALFLINTSVSRAAPPTPAEEAPTVSTAERVLELLKGFHFGTYGRVGYSGDLRQGSMGKSVNIVTHGPRLEEPPYAELDLGYRLERQDALSFRVLFTLGLLEDLFHYNGKFDAKVAIRNLYAEADHVLVPQLSLWVGSRMYRGDDIYLLDFWPLDNLNTLGGGLGLRFGNTRVKLHAGVNRLEDLYQLQEITVVSPGGGGTEQVVVLDRQRTIISLKAVHELPKLLRGISFKAAAYGELHHIPAGTLYREESGLEQEQLPSDLGWVTGLQLGAWGLGENGFANLWLRVAGGLGAYGEIGVPFGLSTDKQALDAREVLVALSANYERGLVGVMAGGYLRYFSDADGVVSDPDDGWEYVFSVRPHLFLHKHFHQVFELSFQGCRPNGLNPETQTHLIPNVFKASVMPTLSWDRGTYTRPQLRVVYTLSYLDEGARLLFARQDPRRGVAVHHFLGAQVEWWFNSSYR